MSHKSIFAPFLRPTQAPLGQEGSSFFASGEPFPPPLIGGEEIPFSPMKNPSDTFLVSSVDWVTFSMVADPEKSLADEINPLLSCVLSWQQFHLIRAKSNLTGCQESWDLTALDPETGEAVALFKVGHMKDVGAGRAYLVFNIPGHCCAYFDMVRLSIIGEHMGAKLTRVDTAVDDFAGEFSVHRARCLYAKGAFQSKGKAHGSMPKYSEVKSGRGKESHGKTLYVGDRKNGKMLRVYEKGLQMNDETRPKWVRWEVQHGNKDREIPWDILRHPAAYFLGAYAPFEKLFGDRIKDATPAYIKTEYEAKSCRSIQQLAKSASTQFGKTIDVLMSKAQADGKGADDVIRILRRPGLPRTLIMPDAETVSRLFDPSNRHRFSEWRVDE